MHIYYVAGVPYSDELYHHGTKGMHWGTRLYQYEDGTLTPLGKIRYGAKKAGESIKSSIKKAHDAKVEKYKRTHPQAMSDEELKAALNRVNMEKTYLQTREEVKMKSSASYRAKKMVERSLEKGGETLAIKAFEAAGNKIVADQRAKDDAAYSKKMAKRAAKNKLMSDSIIDRGQRKQTKKDASSKVAKQLQKNYDTMSWKDMDELGKKYELLKKTENRFRGTNLNSGKKGG